MNGNLTGPLSDSAFDWTITISFSAFVSAIKSISEAGDSSGLQPVNGDELSASELLGALVTTRKALLFSEFGDISETVENVS